MARPARGPADPANAAASLALIDGFSVEMTGKDVPALAEAADRIPAGTRINITFLANEDLPMRVAAAKAIRDAGFVPIPHLSARRLRSRDELEELLGRLQEVGASEHVFAVGGDSAIPDGPYESSLALIDSGVLPRYGVREVGIGGYPEGHPDIAPGVLSGALADKVAALAAQDLNPFVITQFAFDVDPVVAWIDALRDAGVDVPVRVGVPGPVGVRRLLGFARRFGVGANAMIVKKYGFSLTNLMGEAGPDHFVDDLAANLAGRTPAQGRPGNVALHFYTFGGLGAIADWATGFTTERSAVKPPGPADPSRPADPSNED